MTGSFGEEGGLTIARRRIDDSSTLATVFDGPEQDVMPTIHPDGAWIAHAMGMFAAFDTYAPRVPTRSERRWPARRARHVSIQFALRLAAAGRVAERKAKARAEKTTRASDGVRQRRPDQA
jgi:hypothetical protein